MSKFINFLKEYGVTAESYKIDHMMIAVGVIKQMNIEVPLSALLIVYFIYYIFEKNINFKAYAIKYLNGFTLRKIIFENFSKKMHVLGNVNHKSNSFNYKCTLDIKLHG